MKIFIFVTLSIISITIANPFDPKIVGGDFAKEKQFPHQIAIYNKGAFRCGGSIISKNWIVTASHCVLNGNDV